MLGDLINSSPQFVGIPPGINGIGAGYASFRNSMLERPGTVYVGGNDGMLHAFDAASGRERFAYIPSPVFEKLNALTVPGYKHQFYVDGSVTVVDAQLSSCDDCWRTILAGGLRSGGQGIYALDVTTPHLMTTEGRVAQSVLWEFTDRDDPDLGYTYSKPSIVKMSNKRWAVIFGNGYNNTEDDGNKGKGTAVLYILYIDKDQNNNWSINSNYFKLDTGNGSSTAPNGLATPSAVDVDGDFDADFIYAGDLKGNIWRFDVSSDDQRQWKVISQPIFVAGNGQAITVQPQGRRHPQCAGVMLYFGTGKYLEPGDHTIDIPTQKFYGIWDDPESKESNPDEGCGGPAHKYLLQQSIVSDSDGWRETTPYRIEWKRHNGWFINLTNGERVITRPLLRGINILFTTNIPSTDACSFGGDSWLMVLKAESGGSPRDSFDLNGDSEIDEKDRFLSNAGGDGGGDTGTGDGTGSDTEFDEKEKIAITGQKIKGGFSSAPALLHANHAKFDHAYIGSSDGSIRKTDSKNDARTGRLAWRQDD